MIVATSRYQAKELIIESGLAPVRTTLGNPRFKLAYALAGTIHEIAPRRAIFGLSGMEFERAYRLQMETFEPAYFRREFTAIAERAEASGVVLLCFEDVLGKGLQCHRRIFASWWEEQTGERIPELGE